MAASPLPLLPLPRGEIRGARPGGSGYKGSRPSGPGSDPASSSSFSSFSFALREPVLQRARMVLTAEDRKVLQATWSKVAGHLDEMGGDALCRLFTTYPQTKTYFPHFDLSPGSKDVQHHGQKVAKALDTAVHHLDNVRGTLADLADLHAYNLRVDPVNFKLLAKCFHVVLATYLRADYTCVVYLALDKFFYLVAEILAEKYR